MDLVGTSSVNRAADSPHRSNHHPKMSLSQSATTRGRPIRSANRHDRTLTMSVHTSLTREKKPKSGSRQKKRGRSHTMVGKEAIDTRSSPKHHVSKVSGLSTERKPKKNTPKASSRSSKKTGPKLEKLEGKHSRQSSGRMRSMTSTDGGGLPSFQVQISNKEAKERDQEKMGRIRSNTLKYQESVLEDRQSYKDRIRRRVEMKERKRVEREKHKGEVPLEILNELGFNGTTMKEKMVELGSSMALLGEEEKQTTYHVLEMVLRIASEAKKSMTRHIVKAMSDTLRDER